MATGQTFSLLREVENLNKQKGPPPSFLYWVPPSLKHSGNGYAEGCASRRRNGPESALSRSCPANESCLDHLDCGGVLVTVLRFLGLGQRDHGLVFALGPVGYNQTALVVQAVYAAGVVTVGEPFQVHLVRGKNKDTQKEGHKQT